MTRGDQLGWSEYFAFLLGNKSARERTKMDVDVFKEGKGGEVIARVMIGAEFPVRQEGERAE